MIINHDGTYEYNAQEYAHASLREDVRAEVRSQMEELKKDMPNCDGANFILWVCAACLFIAGIMAWHDSIFEKGKKAALEEKKSE